MGKIIGDKKKVVASFTQEELNEITSDLNKKIAELTEENVKLREEKDCFQETIENLNKKIAELTEEVDKKAKKDSKKENE